jgi:hypothetical protein
MKEVLGPLLYMDMQDQLRLDVILYEVQDLLSRIESLRITIFVLLPLHK